MAVKRKVAEGIPTIDVALLVMRYKEGEDTVELAIDTSSQVQVATQSETTEAIKLMKLQRLLAQKPASTVITGMQLTITDNVFSAEQVRVLQGGEIHELDGKIVGYTPPISGSRNKGLIFEIDSYSAIYDESGEIIGYERITYPNCSGTPVALNTQDDTFRTPEYVINSAPKKGQAPYDIEYVEELPDFSGTGEAGTPEQGGGIESEPQALRANSRAKLSTKSTELVER